MNNYLFLGSMFLFSISITNKIKAQELSSDQQTFCKYIISVFNDRKVKKFIFSNKSSDKSAIKNNEIYFLSDKTPFCCDKIYDFSNQNISFHFYRDVDLFFYTIKCPVIIDSLNIQQVSGMLNLSIYRCKENDQNDSLKCSYYFQLRNDKWVIKKKKIKSFKM